MRFRIPFTPWCFVWTRCMYCCRAILHVTYTLCGWKTCDACVVGPV